MPWVHYPRTGMKLYGYVGDGIITFAIFLSMLILSFFVNKFVKFTTFYFILLGGSLFALGFYNLSQIRLEQLSSNSENIGINIAAAGFHEGIGVYLNMFGGLGCFIGGLMLLIQLPKRKLTNTSNQALINKFKLIPPILGFVMLMGTLAYFLPQNFKISNNNVPSNIESLIEKDINVMVNALQNNDFESYSNLVHPVLAQSMGGQKMLKDFFEGTHKTFLMEKIKINKISVEKILDIKTRTKDKQVLFIQKIVFSQNGKEFDEKQKTLAINNNVSKEWKYITLGNDKKIEEIRKMYPEINEELKFLEN